MKRILVIGSCGAGKSVFSTLLSKKLTLPLIHLDHLFWLPNWQQADIGSFDNKLHKKLNKNTWIIDGNYNRTLSKRIGYADTVIYLNYNRWVCLFRVLKRWLNKKEQSEGCQATINIKFLWYVFYGYPKKHRPIIKKHIKHYKDVNWIELKNPREAEIFLSNL